MFAVLLIAEISREWNLPVWIAAVDFQKVFDTISHESLWESLAEQNVPDMYIKLLRRLYQGQTGKVSCDRCSRSFNIERGTKQGDPISPILFNATLEKIMRAVKRKWQSRKYGLEINNGTAEEWIG